MARRIRERKTLNSDLIRRTVKRIEEENQWDQYDWVSPGEPLCDTKFCFAGHALIEYLGFEDFTRRYLLLQDGVVLGQRADYWSGDSEPPPSIAEDARKVLGLSDYSQTDALFYGNMDSDLKGLKDTIEENLGVSLDEPSDPGSRG